ncbi:unnamed protein product [Rhizophagus irregularis]|nr:unnamed protein product [Rhizophagus irregularis]CAB5385508.1 unnamed protein product [Rhizophagus irregularis]
MNTYTKNLSVPDQNRKKTLIDPVAAISEGALAETSDDTRELKHNHECFKRRRSSPTILDDSIGVELF